MVTWASALLEAGEQNEDAASKELAGVIAETGLKVSTGILTDEQQSELNRIRSAAMAGNILAPTS